MKMLVVLENIGKLGLGGLFGGAVAKIALIFFEFSSANGALVEPSSIVLCGAFLGASIGRLLDRLFFVPLETSKRRRKIIADIRSERLPIELRNDLISKVYLEDIEKR